MLYTHEVLLVQYRHRGLKARLDDFLQAWQAAHPPVRGRHWMGRRPRVHAGFLKSWLAGGLKDKVVARVLKAIQDEKDGGPITRVLITGLRYHMPCLCMASVAHCCRAVQGLS